jgi:hypothetical protein
LETPLTSQELVNALVEERIERQKKIIEKQRTSGGDLYQPKTTFLLEPKFDISCPAVVAWRSNWNPSRRKPRLSRIPGDPG